MGKLNVREDIVIEKYTNSDYKALPDINFISQDPLLPVYIGYVKVS